MRLAPNAKQLVYYYNGDQSKPDVEEDLGGEVAVPANKSMIMRHGHPWEVVIVNEEGFSDGRIPVFKVFLRTPPPPQKTD